MKKDFLTFRFFPYGDTRALWEIQQFNNMYEIGGPKRPPMPRHPKNREKDPAAFDAALKWQADMEARRAANMAAQEEQYKLKKEQQAKQLDQFYKNLGVVLGAMEQSANSIPFTGQEYRQAAEAQRQEKIDKVHEIATGFEAALTADLGRGLYPLAKKGLSSLSTALIPKNKRIPNGLQVLKEQAGNSMLEFVNSQDYKERAIRAGHPEYADFMKKQVSERLNNNKYPVKVVDMIRNNPNIKGDSGPNLITLQRGIPINASNSPRNVLDHELSHYTTEGLENEGFLLDEAFKGTEEGTIARIMQYNDEIAPMRKDWNKFGISKKAHAYLETIQERRARAYDLIQRAKREGISTDELVDKFTIKGEIDKSQKAPSALKELNAVYTPENIKKFLKNFLSFASPVGIGVAANATYNQNNSETNK